ncbi:MAG: hypothetical protein IKH12_03130 [Clostridia bacterium]|nr:hypothetical protein [Clostridia bacterium]
MKKTTVRLLCFLCALCLLIPACPLMPLAAEKETVCGGDCPYYPTIIVPGLGQSSVVVTDDSGAPLTDRDGKKVSAFPAWIQTGKLIRTLLGPALLSLFAQRDVGFSDAFAEAIYDAFSINRCDENAIPEGNVLTEKFPYSYAKYSDYDKYIVNQHIPFELYPTDLPRDHLYYFEYNSFGNHIGLANELYDFIQLVKAQTGHDKVNLVPLSQGASIVSAMLEYTPAVMDELHKILFVVPALDGSRIIGDVFNDEITFLDSNYLYHGFLENIRLLDAPTAGLIELAARLFPDEVLMSALQKGVRRLVENVMIRSTGMWALCPSGAYESAAARYLSSPDMAAIKAQTDRYYQVQLHHKDNIRKLQQKGVQVFCVAEYDISLINVGAHWNDQNADFIIQLDSTSMGATSANVGETLPADYKQQNTCCSNPAHDHISPDRVIDASTGLLPDTTFYFKNQRHDLTQWNDVILKLAMQLIAHDDIKDVYTSPAFPQFNYGRNVKNLLALLDKAAGVNRKLLTRRQKAKLNAAVENAEAVLSRTVDGPTAVPDAEAQLHKALVLCGKEKPTVETPDVFTPVSDFLYRHFGSDGYSEYPRLTAKRAVDGAAGFFGAGGKN